MTKLAMVAVLLTGALASCSGPEAPPTIEPEENGLMRVNSTINSSFTTSTTVPVTTTSTTITVAPPTTMATVVIDLPAPPEEPHSHETPAGVVPAGPSTGIWDDLAGCESGGDWGINTGNGYYGGLQFSRQSWQAVGGTGLPSDASRAEQIQRAQELQSIQGWGAWPSCSRKIGAR